MFEDTEALEHCPYGLQPWDLGLGIQIIYISPEVGSLGPHRGPEWSKMDRKLGQKHKKRPFLTLRFIQVQEYTDNPFPLKVESWKTRDMENK